MDRPALSMPCAALGCGPLVNARDAAQALCGRCGLVFRSAGDDVVVDALATRAALFAAAAACAGPDWSLQALVFDRYDVDPSDRDRIARLALAENGVASLCRLGI